MEKVFGNVEYIDAQGVTGELGFVTEGDDRRGFREQKSSIWGSVECHSCSVKEKQVRNHMEGGSRVCFFYENGRV